VRAKLNLAHSANHRREKCGLECEPVDYEVILLNKKASR